MHTFHIYRYDPDPDADADAEPRMQVIDLALGAAEPCVRCRTDGRCRLEQHRSVFAASAHPIHQRLIR